MMTSSNKDGNLKKPSKRTAARMGAVQALYQYEIVPMRPDKLIEEFLTHRLGQLIEGMRFGKADEALFADLIRGTLANLGEVDAMIAGILTESWDLDRLEAILRAILRSGTYEMAFRLDIPPKVIINEYAAITDAFFGEKETGMANGVLDKLAKELRPQELG